MTQIRANGITLEYDEHGPRDGVPFLFINGFGSQMTNWPDEFHQNMAKGGISLYPLRQSRCRPVAEMDRRHAGPESGFRSGARR